MKIFISHSSKDKRFVKKIKDDLEENSISTWFDEDELGVGDSLVDKLDEAIVGSSHFIIVLSPNSVESEWVKHELTNAIMGNSKIIPIKYKECNIPNEIQKMVYLDLSKETVERKGERIEFITDGYQKQLVRLVREIKSNKYKLTKTDKSDIQKKLIKDEENLKEVLIKIHLKIIGFTPRGKRRAIQKLKDKGIQKPVPMTLPSIFKKMNINDGDKFSLSSDSDESQTAHLAGFRSDDLKIAMSKEIIDKMELEKYSIQAFEVDCSKKTIKIL